MVVSRAVGKRIHGSTGAFFLRFGFDGSVFALRFGLGGSSRSCDGGGEDGNEDDKKGAVVVFGMSS